MPQIFLPIFPCGKGSDKLVETPGLAPNLAGVSLNLAGELFC